jgi:uncharacterized protein YfkK (UPF0435 family)
LAAVVEKSRKKMRDDTQSRTLLEYDSMIEELRTRLNVLNTSLFLLHESTKSDDPNLIRYLKQINKEMEKIRQIISKYPKNSK